MFARLEEGVLIVAPQRMHYFKEGKEIFVVNPSEEELREQGFLPVIEIDAPIVEEDEYSVPFYTQENDVILQKWEVKKMEILENEFN